MIGSSQLEDEQHCAASHLPRQLLQRGQTRSRRGWQPSTCCSAVLAITTSTALAEADKGMRPEGTEAERLERLAAGSWAEAEQLGQLGCGYSCSVLCQDTGAACSTELKLQNPLPLPHPSAHKGLPLLSSSHPATTCPTVRRMWQAAPKSLQPPAAKPTLVGRCPAQQVPKFQENLAAQHQPNCSALYSPLFFSINGPTKPPQEPTTCPCCRALRVSSNLQPEGEACLSLRGQHRPHAQLTCSAVGASRRNLCSSSSSFSNSSPCVNTTVLRRRRPRPQCPASASTQACSSSVP